MASISWHLDGVVLDHVLLDDGLAGAKVGGLCDGSTVEVGLRDEAVVAWDVRRGLGCTHGQLVVLVTLRLCLAGKLRARVVAVGAHRFLELSLVVASLGGVSLARVAPDGTLRLGEVGRHLALIGHLFVRFPMACCVSKTLLGRLSLSHHVGSLCGVVSGTACVGEELWLVHEVVLDQVVSVLGWHCVVTWLDSS